MSRLRDPENNTFISQVFNTCLCMFEHVTGLMLYALQHKVHTSEITSINALFGILIHLFFSHYQHNLKSWGNIKPDDPCYPSMTWAKSMLCALMYENLTFCTKESYIFFAYAITDLEIAQNQRCCILCNTCFSKSQNCICRFYWTHGLRLLDPTL